MRQANVGKLRAFIFEDRDSMGQAAAEKVKKHILELFQTKETINMIFAAAPSQNEMLKALSEDEDIDFARINAFHMDEYIGLSPDAPQGFGNFLREKLFGVRKFRTVNYIDGNAESVERECGRYTELLKNNPPDIVCGGIGENSHIAFNDPGVADFHDPVLIKPVALDEMCRQQQVNDGCFSTLEKVPKMALTLTVPVLMRATYKVYTVPSSTKANAVRSVFVSEVDEKVPASILRRETECTMYLDADSASMIPREYFVEGV